MQDVVRQAATRGLEAAGAVVEDMVVPMHVQGRQSVATYISKLSKELI